MLNDSAKAGVKRFLLLQGIVIFVISLALWRIVDVKAAYSALLGGLVCLLPTWYFAARYFRYSGARSAQKILSAFYRGEAIKLFLTVAFFALIFKYINIAAMPFFVTFIVVQSLVWVTPLIFK